MAEERRKVVVDEPGLTDETNQALTEELRAAIGDDEVRVPAERPKARIPQRRSGFLATLSANRLILIITFLTLLVVGAIVALATDKWWIIVIPLAMHAVATIALGAGILQTTTQVERPDPGTVARMEEEGVPDPEGTFNEMVDEYGGGGARNEAADVVTPGDNERTTGAQEEPGKSAAEQRTAITPGSRPERSGGESSAIAFLPWYVVGGVIVASVAFAIAVGGAMWIAPAVVIPLGIAWIAIDRVMSSRS